MAQPPQEELAKLQTKYPALRRTTFYPSNLHAAIQSSTDNYKGMLLPEKTLTLPKGVIAIHFKYLNHMDLSYDHLFAHPNNVAVYLRIKVGNKTRLTRKMKTNGNSQVLIDCIRHMTIQIPTTTREPESKIYVDLFGIEKAYGSPKLIGEAIIKVYDVIKKLFIVEKIQLRKRVQVVAELAIEICFAYGSFGYGYSNQLENKQRSPQSAISHSMFPRFEPPPRRTSTLSDKFSRDVMTCQLTEHPQVVHFSVLPQIYTTPILYNVKNPYPSEEFVPSALFVNTVMAGYDKLRKRYASLDSRNARLKWLEERVTKREFDIEPTVHYEEEVTEIESPTDTAFLKLLLKAPGITKTKTTEEYDRIPSATARLPSRTASAAQPEISYWARLRAIFNPIRLVKKYTD